MPVHDPGDRGPVHGTRPFLVWKQNPHLMKNDDETSSAADVSDRREVDAEHLSTPSPDTSEYNSENEVEGSSVAEEEDDDAEENGEPLDEDDDDDDDDDDDTEDDNDGNDSGDRTNSGRVVTAAEAFHQVRAVIFEWNTYHPFGPDLRTRLS